MRKQEELYKKQEQKKKETETTVTIDNIHGHHFRIPAKIYLDKGYRDRLNTAKTLAEVEGILDSYKKQQGLGTRTERTKKRHWWNR